MTDIFKMTYKFYKQQDFWFSPKYTSNPFLVTNHPPNYLISQYKHMVTIWSVPTDERRHKRQTSKSHSAFNSQKRAYRNTQNYPHTWDGISTQLRRNNQFIMREINWRYSDEQWHSDQDLVCKESCKQITQNCPSSHFMHTHIDTIFIVLHTTASLLDWH